MERPDSISIAMQVEHCRRICPAEAEVRVFTDRGFTGTNTHRPAFREMLEAVEQGEVKSVYVYKLDRISRSHRDFAAMMQTFRRRNVTLHSVRESFDTRTEIGGMLLNLLMMFAELEQKTIAGRVRDNYYARAAQQLALGGTPPYGYTGKNVRISNHTATILEVQPDEAAQVQAFYTGYGIAGQNVEQLVQAANRSGSRTRNGANWSNSAVLRILRSPVYVRGDLRSAVFLQEQGVELTHPLEQYCQGNGYLVYGSPAARHGAKLTRLQGEHMAAGLHPGIVDSDLWLSVQERLAARGGCTNRGTGHRSWLQGWRFAVSAAHTATPEITARAQRIPISSAGASARASVPASPVCAPSGWRTPFRPFWHSRQNSFCPMRRQRPGSTRRRWRWRNWNSGCAAWRRNCPSPRRRQIFSGKS